MYALDDRPERERALPLAAARRERPRRSVRGAARLPPPPPPVLPGAAPAWPADRLRVHLLDDGRREAFRRFAAEAGVGYVTRPDNRHAKAGNLNHALSVTHGEFIAIFDCDHVPARSFLQVTMGWLLRDRRLAIVQTPHHFYSPDPFSRNLRTAGTVPSESELFYGVIQPGIDTWNAAFFCGSCAVLRRSAVEAGGGGPAGAGRGEAPHPRQD